MKIISGYLKNRKIKIKSKSEVRPTLNLVREAIFDYISEDITNKTFLDLFAGTGSMSFEALSRGAKKIYQIEKDKSLFIDLKNNLTELKIQKEKYFVKNWNSIIFLKRTKDKFDYIYIDPPYKLEKLYKDILEIIIERKLLTKQGIIILERDKRNKILENKKFNLNLTDERKYGNTIINFLNQIN